MTQTAYSFADTKSASYQLASTAMTNEEKQKIKEILDAFYQGANGSTWNGEINDAVAETVKCMLEELSKCSAAANWVPRPTMSVPTVTYLVTQITRAVIGNLKGGSYKFCQNQVLFVWGTPLQMASALNMFTKPMNR